MLCDFSSGTQVVARLRRPVTQTACVLVVAGGEEVEAERRLAARPAAAAACAAGRARRAGAPAGATSPACEPTGSSALRTTLVPSPRWLRAVAPAMSTSRRHQPKGRHSSGSTWRTAWIRP